MRVREFTENLVAQSLVPRASVAAIAMKGGINANLLFESRREHVRAKTEVAPAPSTLLPVCVVADAEPAPTSQPPTACGAVASRSARSGVIEIEIAGIQLRLRGAIDEAAWSSVLRALIR